MGGGLLQLIAVGQIDQYLSINPELSFYQYVYKRHTNFAMESRQLTFQKNPTLSHNTISNIVECTIPRHGDLLKEIYFCFTLPDIYSSDKYQFRWVKNIGNNIIKKASVYIDGMLIDQITGEWLNIWNEMTNEVGQEKYSKMIGNVPELYEPKSSKDRVSIKNNRFYYFYYPESSKSSNIPSIKQRQIIVPLKFWFTKVPSMALPLLRLQYNVVSIKLELESSENLYQVFSPDLEMFISPIYFNELYGEKININTFTKEYLFNPYIEANYVYLGEEERNSLFMKSKISYLVEQLNINTAKSFSSKSAVNNNIDVIVNTPTKEIIWTTRRDDYYKYNEFMNFSADIPETNNGILDKAYITFYNNNRIEEKPAEYFNIMQPYQYHSRVPKQGIYSYSFALYPEKEFLSGYYNAALVKTNLYVSFKDIYNNDFINTKLSKVNKQQYEYNYQVNIYCVCYNIFEIIGNQVGMKFTLSA